MLKFVYDIHSSRSKGILYKIVRNPLDNNLRVSNRAAP